MCSAPDKKQVTILQEDDNARGFAVLDSVLSGGIGNIIIMCSTSETLPSDIDQIYDIAIISSLHFTI